MWSAPAERSGDGALASRGAERTATTPGTANCSAGPESGVALRLPPQSKTGGYFARAEAHATLLNRKG